MSLEQWSFIAEILASAAVVATLCFVAVQGVRSWWKMDHPGYSPRFTAYIARRIAETPVEPAEAAWWRHGPDSCRTSRRGAGRHRPAQAGLNLER
jgi:hypothetical protein